MIFRISLAVLCRLLEWVINLMDKEELFVKRIRELANLAYQRDITTFTDFLNLNERNILNSQISWVLQRKVLADMRMQSVRW